MPGLIGLRGFAGRLLAGLVAQAVALAGGRNADDYAHHVGAKLSNPWGLFDMHGNVWEWSVSNGRPVLRSGSWGDAARTCRSAFRFIGLAVQQHNGDAGCGLRVVCDVRR